jgi:lipopolysaccharide/colanic/teichoic acid biosynthesis glycosyltransferase
MAEVVLLRSIRVLKEELKSGEWSSAMHSSVPPFATDWPGWVHGQLVIKRALDVLIAVLALFILSPLLLVLALLVKLESSGPIIFRQQRLGRAGRTFTMYKFRSMYQRAPLLYNADGSTKVIEHDPRVTRLGALMRRSCLDELPQLFNILRGDMSLVGPRPDPAFYREYYQTADYRKLAMRPGLTALAHVLGRQTIGWRDRFPIEQRYIECYSLWLDLKIILATPMVVFSGIGVYNSPDKALAPAIPDHPWFRSVLRSRVYSRSNSCLVSSRSGSMQQHIPPRIFRSIGRLFGLALALVFPVTALAAPASEQLKRVSPVLECVRTNSDGSYTAFFGYYNPNSVAIELPIGNEKGRENNFYKQPSDMGQPTTFHSGRHRAVFSVQSAGSNLLWKLNKKTSTASAGSYQCATSPLDFNNDGTSDIFWRDNATGANALWLMDGNNVIETLPINQLSDTNWTVAAVYDFNADNSPDIFWRHKVSGANAVWYMNGAEFVSATGMNTLTDTNWQMVGMADFDQDGTSDIFWRHAISGANVAWFMAGTSFSGAAGLQQVSDSNWEIKGLHDFNRDGMTDILWRHGATGSNAIWYMNGTSIASGAAVNQVSEPDWQIVGTHDFNHDGYIDLLWRNASSGANALWLMEEHALAAAISLSQVSDTDWHVVAINDVNGDTHPDIFWRHATQGHNVVWHMHEDGSRTMAGLNTLSDTNWTPAGVNIPAQKVAESAGEAQVMNVAYSMSATVPATEPIMMDDEMPADLMDIEAAGEVMAMDVPVEYAAEYTPSLPSENIMPEEPAGDMIEAPTDDTSDEPDTITVDESEEITAPVEQYQVYLPLVLSNRS